MSPTLACCRIVYTAAVYPMSDIAYTAAVYAMSDIAYAAAVSLTLACSSVESPLMHFSFKIIISGCNNFNDFLKNQVSCHMSLAQVIHCILMYW